MGTLVLKIVYFILIILFSEYVTGANEMEFRLRKFDDQANDGIAQLFFNGTLGAVDIADPDINVNFTAKALCNSIGLGYKGFTSRNYNGSPMLTWINDFTCNASYAAGCIDEKSLILRNTTISAIVHCYAYEITDIRLTGDILPSRGFVEFKISERWVAVNTSKRFDYSWNGGIGETFCQALGYVGESIIQPETRGSGNTIMAISFDRTGYCDVIGSIFDITHKCETRLNLSTSSFMQIYCMPIQLIDGQSVPVIKSVLMGRVEATLFGRIHTICGRGFDNNAANVACKSLGFSGWSNLNLKTEYGVGNQTLYSRKISCNGTELSLEQCNHSNVHIEACGVEDVVSVACKGNQVQLETISDARPYEGVLTAYYDSHLYYFTGHLDASTARTFCSWLGFGDVGFSQGIIHYRRNMTYCKSLLSCKGNINYIDECLGVFLPHLLNECIDGVIGLFCSDYKIQHINLVSDVIELTINNETWSVCGDTSSETFGTTADTVCRINGNATDPLSQPKYVVFEENLMSLFQQCPMCGLHTESEITQRQGSYIAVRQDCLCGYQRRWESQPRIGATPAGNVLMCAALLFSGCSASKIFRMFSFFNLVTVTLDTFWEHQKKFLWPAIDRVWTSYQSKVHESIRARGGRVIVAGDGRADSPGHSAKFGVYTMVDLETGKVIDMQLVQSNEVKSSYHIELEGLKRAVDNLKTKGITIAEIITDRHMQIQKWIRENLVGSTHSYDVWHIAKGLKKKLLALGKEKDCVIVNSWVKSITNHLYWSASSSKHGDGDLIVAKWKSVANHVQNVHNNHGDVYRACEHEQLTDRDWLKPGSKASVKLEDIILNKRLCTDIKKMSTSYQTSFLESLHSVMNHFAAKMYGYSYHGQLYRQQLAALHFDENLKREVKIGKDGKPQVKILFPKYKRNDEYTVKLCREEMTFSYVMELLQETVNVCEGKQVIQVISPAPPPLSSSKRKPNKTEALASLTSRFKKMKK